MQNDIFSSLPKAIRLKEKLKDQIRNGMFGRKGDFFPSVRSLAERVDVSLVTAQRIMTMLKDEEIIFSEKRKNILSEKAFESNSDNPIRPRKKIVGMVVTNLDNPFFSSLAKEMELVAEKAGYQLLISSSNYDLKREKQALAMFEEAGVSGVISCPTPTNGVERLYKNLSVPFVFVARSPDDINADSIIVDNFKAAKLVATHFIEKGFSRFAYLGLEILKKDQRFDGFKYGLAEKGFELAKSSIFKAEDLSFTKLPDMFISFLRTTKNPLAIFCFHDLLAFQVQKECLRLGLNIPNDVAVVGFDNLPFTTKTTPTITTVGYPLKNMSDLAFKRLLERLSNDGKSLETVNLSVEPKLIIRGSTSEKSVPIENKIISADFLYQAS